MATLKKSKNGFQYQLSLNAGQKYCKMLQGVHSAIISTFIELLLVIKIFILSSFEWPFKTGLLYKEIMVGLTADNKTQVVVCTD